MNSLQNNNLQNNCAYLSCPALMADGRDSINTDYRPKNDAFKILKDDISKIFKETVNAYEFRSYLQSPMGFNSIVNDVSNYTVCNPVPFGTSTFPQNPIQL